MPQSLSVLYAHLIFSTKRREPTLTSDVRPQTHAYLAGIMRSMGGVAGHVPCSFAL